MKAVNREFGGRYFGLLVVALLLVLCQVSLALPVEVAVTLRNDFDKSFSDLPVVLKVSQIFGRGVDYSKMDPRNFHVSEAGGKEWAYLYRELPPLFSIADDEIILMVPSLAKGAEIKLRFSYTAQPAAKRGKFDMAAFLANANNLIPNGGFEKGADEWKGGKIVTDVIHSGKNAMLLEVPGSGGNTTVTCGKKLPFVKDRNYHFEIWAKSENVIRKAWRHHFNKTPISGEIRLSGNPLVLREYLDFMLVMDDRDWYDYKAEAYSCDPTPRPARATTESELTIALIQQNMPYLDANKPARIWIDDVVLLEQPRVEISCAELRKQAAPEGHFLYRRSATCLNPAQFATDRLAPPRPYEKVESITDEAAQGERKLVTLGIDTDRPIQGLHLEVSDLKGPGGTVIGENARDIEFNYVPTEKYEYNATSLEGWVIDGNPPRNIDRPGFVDYLVAFYFPADAKPGKYEGSITVLSADKTLGKVPVEITVVGYPLKVLTDRFAGLVYNGNMSPMEYRWTPGYKGSNGARALAEWGLDDQQLRYYARHGFTYMMMFSRFIPFTEKGNEVNLEDLKARMKRMRDIGKCTAGVGVYWDSNCAPDGKHGLLQRAGGNQDMYRARAKEMDDCLAKAGLPRLMYMIWDEPRSYNPIFEILKGTGAYCTSDINYTELCESIVKGVFTHPAVDGPGCEFGPAFSKFAKKNGLRLGYDSYAGPYCHRYQTGLMLASGDVPIMSLWHLGYYLAYHEGHKALVRAQQMVGMGEGMVDLQYHDTLADVIAQAKKKGVAAKEVAEAEKYLKEIFKFCTIDFGFIGEIDGGTYNGGPERWGDDWFYDNYRAKLRHHTLAITQQLRGAGGSTARK